MKIIAGEFKGRNFFMPKDIRPTQSIARKAIFDILGARSVRARPRHGGVPVLKGVTFLDLFAGSGAMGLEALSRGASRVTFVEKDQRCAEILKENTGLLTNAQGVPDNLFLKSCELIHSDAFASIKILAGQARKFDIVFLDPPYRRGLAKKALKTLEAHDILSDNSLLIIQREKREILPDRQGRFLLYRQRKFGNSVVDFYRQE